MALTIEEHKKLLDTENFNIGNFNIGNEDLYDRPITNTRFASCYMHDMGSNQFRIVEDNNEDITIEISPLCDDKVYYKWKDKQIVLRYPASIDKKFLSSITHIHNSVSKKYPKLTPEFIADQLIKNGDINMMIPLRGIYVLTQHEFGKKYKEYDGFAILKEQAVYINIDSNINSFWSILCHEIRHIGLECNPSFYYQFDDFKREEEYVYTYGLVSSLVKPWDDSWIE